MALLNFPPNPAPGETWTIGTRTWEWNGTAWQLQTGVSQTDPFTVVSLTVTTTTNSTSTVSGGVQIAGGVGIAGNVNVGGTITVHGANLTSFTAPAVTANTEVVLDTFDITKYRTAKYLVQIADYDFTPNLVQSSEILITHDDNGASTQGYIVQYGLITNFGELGSWTVNYDHPSTSLILTFSPNYVPGTMLVRIYRTLLEV